MAANVDKKKKRRQGDLVSITNIAAAGAVDREFVYIFRVFFIWGPENGLMESREGSKKVPGGHTIHSGRV